MNKLILVLIVFTCSYGFAQNLSFKDSSNINQNIQNPEDLTLKDFPSVQRGPASVESEGGNEEKRSYSLQFTSHLLDGSYYLGKVGTPAQLNSYSLELLAKKNNFLYQIALDRMNNTGNITITEIAANIGAYKDIGIFSLDAYAGMGIANYKEKSAMQNVDSTGLGLQATLAASCYLGNNFYFNANYKFFHLMFTNGLNYWGKDPRHDVVFDLHGFGFGLGWRF
jgi:hypothetical protein